MAIVVFPVDAVTGAPSYTGRLARQTLAPLLAGATAARPLGARSGVRPGTSATTVTATSTLWTMGLHAGILDMETAVEAGPYAYAVNTAQTGAVTAADATRPRVDIVWVRLDDPAESDGSSVPAVVAGYTAGAPLALPVAPATPARCMVLATINVPLSGGGSPTVIWVAPYTVAAGAPTPVYSASDRDAKFPTPYDGLQVYRLDLHLVETYNGTAWVNPGAGFNMGTPTAASTTSTATAAAAETRDATLGDYVFTAVAGRRYRAILDGASINSTVANDVYRVAIRNGGASTPTAASTLVAMSQVQVVGASSAGRPGCQVAGTFVPGAGVVTLSLFLQRYAGTGVGSAVNVGIARELYAVDLGPA